MDESILSHIASKFITEYENVANSSIAYLLNKYSAARESLRIILNVETVPNYYVTESSTKGHGRPDITSSYDDGSKIIIEGKFWANLTENQPNNYIKELGSKGRLLFLAPEKRENSLKSEIEIRLRKIDERIMVYSWKKFIELIESENKKEYNDSLASDLLQLKELCQKMDIEGLPP